MPRHIKIALIVLAIGFGVSVGFFVDIVGRVRSMVVNEKETAENPFTPPKTPLYKPTDPPVPVPPILSFPGGVQGVAQTVTP